MIKAKYDSIVRYLGTGQLPTTPTSTVSNFKMEAAHYTLGANNALMREGKHVVRFNDRKVVFESMHRTHSGRGIYTPILVRVNN